MWSAECFKACTASKGLMISVNPSDQDVLRFLRVKDIQADDPDIVVYRYTRVVFGVSSSPFLLNATIRHHLEQFLGTHRELVMKFLCSTFNLR